MAEGNSQNFIPNWSFENYALCPQSRNDGRRSYSWGTPTLGTSDYFNTCANAVSQLDVPNNFAGSQMPRTGNAYSGFYARSNHTPTEWEYREYMQVTLDSFLVAGGIYTFEMYLSLADNSNYAVNKIGAYVSAQKISGNHKLYLNYEPQIISTTYITNKTGWTKVTGTYIATGGEHYITIGVFEPESTNTAIQVTGGGSGIEYDEIAYYYLDDVSMTRHCDLLSLNIGNDVNQCQNQYQPIQITPNINPLGATYLWNTGQTTRIITADTPRTYILKATNSFCAVYDTLKINHAVMPVVNIGNDTIVCNGGLVLSASATNASFYKWNTGSSAPAINVSTSGKYWVEVGPSYCKASDTITVQLANIQPINAGEDVTICGGQSTTLTATNQTGVTWLWSNGEQNRQTIVSQQGYYWVQATKNTCKVRDTVYVKEIPLPTVQLGNDTSICFVNTAYEIIPTEAESYIWHDGSTGNSYQATQAGLYWVQVQDQGCIARDSIVLSAKATPALNLGADKKMCAYDSVFLNSNITNQNIIWSTSANTSGIWVRLPGNYFATITNSVGCFVTDTVLVEYHPTPRVDLGNDTSICEGSLFNLDAGASHSSYLWSDGAVSRINKPNQSGIFGVTVANQFGCKSYDAIDIKFFPKPQVSLIPLIKICNVDTFVTLKTNAASILWSDGSTDTTLYLTDYGIYTALVTDSNQCINIAQVEVRNICPPKLFVPNAFTPHNKDDVNDLFMPVALNVVKLHLQVYNRWGELVFETNELNSGWNGMYKQEQAQADVYVYTITYEGADTFVKTKHGNVTLLK